MMWRHSTARTTLILVCIQLGTVNAKDPTEVNPSQATGQGHDARQIKNQSKTEEEPPGSDEESVLSQRMTWVSVCLIVPSAVGMVVMVSSCCMCLYRRWAQTDSFSPVISGTNMHVYDEFHPTKNYPHSGPNPMAFWHGTLASSNTTTPNPSGCQSKGGPEPLQYLDLMLEPRSYETIPKDKEMTSYAEVHGELRKSANRRFSFLQFKHT